MNAAVEKMRAEGLPEVAVETFARHLSRLGAGERGVLSEAEIEPVDELPDAEELPDDPAGSRGGASPRRGDQAERRPRHRRWA